LRKQEQLQKNLYSPVICATNQLSTGTQEKVAAPSLIREKRNSHISQTTQEINSERFGEIAHIIRTLFHLCLNWDAFGVSMNFLTLLKCCSPGTWS